MRNPRFIMTLPESDRNLLEKAKGRDSLSMFILKAAVKEAEFRLYGESNPMDLIRESPYSPEE